MTFYIIELIILGIFVIEIALHIFSYHCLYLEDMWNLFDFIVIILSIIFVLLDMSLAGTNSFITGFLKIRGIFRLLRIFILIRKLNALRVKREAQKRKMTTLGYDLRSPLEKVLEILNEVRDSLDKSEERMIQDLNYCIKMISSN